MNRIHHLLENKGGYMGIMKDYNQLFMFVQRSVEAGEIENELFLELMGIQRKNFRASGIELEPKGEASVPVIRQTYREFIEKLNAEAPMLLQKYLALDPPTQGRG